MSRPIKFVVQSSKFLVSSLKTTNSTRGFTILELLVVVALIGILAGIFLSVLKPNAFFAESRNTQRRNDLRQLQVALQNYFNDKGGYPCSTAPYNQIPCNAATWRGEATSYGGLTTDYIGGLVTTYLKKLPNDPKANQANSATGNPSCSSAPGQNGYLYRSNGLDYKVLSHCAYEAPYPVPSDPWYDPSRPTWAIQVSSDGGSAW